MGEFIAIIALLLTVGAPAIISTALAVMRHRENLEAMKRGINTIAARPAQPPKTGNAVLLTSSIAIALGLSLIVSAVFVQQYFDRDMITAGIIILFSGAAMLVYWKITAPDRKLAREMYEKQIQYVVAQSHAIDPGTE